MATAAEKKEAVPMGLVHIYCGDGKGKTSAAVGLAVRFAGSGGKVLFYQFMKPESSGERRMLQQLSDITVLSGYQVSKFSFQMNESEKAEAAVGYQKQFSEIIQMVQNEAYGLLVLDEIMSCISCGFLDIEAVLHFLECRPQSLEVVMTGRNPDARLIACADYVSEIQKVKHPFDAGITARSGIEF